ncbi:hypothetical protein GGI25_005796 [Coemansia spiralis]|uniref:Endonuclease/exonuclease/phosphatase domain-containing protein n=2 Tax=Coemansia TaxID=4863 RepID=A0A9W8KUB9_9FUNG|nr:Endonuclease/exonuclease/phosphatase [Coemansia spiralis]KAJ1987289.1 hypothetical protein EDC05_005909 [Coemansia umbellata]KAJ2619198.1 hypothetical protein GGI26_006017 [Coemansia sp. RSA 1358]KAJ2670551.1 hypothetical protein GGI25_005796 [Coemansia spiralis]
MDLALPGELIKYDYRSAAEHSDTAGILRPLRVVQWNIERGYRLEAVLAVLEELDADILCLQEIDIGNERSGNTNHGQAIAERLGLNGGIVIEFQELRSPCRHAAQQGGGIHGNAIYSKFDMSFRVIEHTHQPYNWQRDGMLLGEPRIGHRYTLAAEVLVQERPPVLAYSAHFECFTGIIGRTRQLCDLLLDSKNAAVRLPHQVIFGDFNTFAHSLARFSPKYANGWYRFRTIGISEPEWWVKNILSWYSEDGNINRRLDEEGLPSDIQFSNKILRAAVNPGWYDPFDTVKDITILSHAGWMTAKADWAFVRQLSVVRHWMENRSFSASDHRCLVLEIEHAHPEILEEHKRITQRNAYELALKRSSKFWTWCSLIAATALSYIAIKLARSSMVSKFAKI